MKIGIVNDLPMAVESLRRALTGSPAANHQLAWVARDGAEAVRRCVEDRPDLVLMDLIMPGMDGVEATRLIMTHAPCAILLVSATPGRRRAGFSRRWARARSTWSPRRPPPRRRPNSWRRSKRWDGTSERTSGGKRPPGLRSAPRTDPAVPERIVAIGSSAGGPAALAEVLGGLPVDFPRVHRDRATPGRKVRPRPRAVAR